jgi:hypothetical protein
LENIYGNDGDFVESCTVLVEEYDGTLKVLQWDEKTSTAIELLSLKVD